MKAKLRIISMVCVLAMLFASFTVLASASEYEFEKPVEAGMWENPKWSTDHAYSFAFVGDTQYIACGDYYQGTEKMNQIYGFIADTVEERKLQHVFVLGDITDMGYWNDANLASAHVSPPVYGEWEIAKEAISQLDGKISYSLCRGNHDDYMIDDYFNVPEYTKNFDGFFSDVNGKHSGKREKLNSEGYILWSAKKEAETGNGRYTESIVNSYKTMEIYGTKYLFVTVDYNPTRAVVNWVDEILGKYPDHKAIITTHSYLNGAGDLITSEEGNTMYPTGFAASMLWKLALRKHANVFMVVSGHVGVTVPFYSWNTGDNGNKVLQVLVDPQSYDLKEGPNGEVKSGTQDTGLVLYMNFSEDGKTITFDYYSTLLGKFLKNCDYTISVDSEIDEVGSVDMAGLTEFGQTTPLVKEKTTVTLDGVISEGEYPEVKVTKQADIATGRINSDLTEYFAYDDDYLYYAFTLNTPVNKYKLNLHFGSSLYTVAELNDSIHSRKAIFTFTNDACTQETNLVASKLKNGVDISCKAIRDNSTKLATYELKISREYLRNNGSPDNLLSYTLTLGSANHQFKLGSDVKEYLEGLGVTNSYTWTYNYAYFGTRPETVPDAVETEAATGGEETSGNTANGGCGSTVGFASVAIVCAIAGAACVRRKKRSN